MDYKSIVEPADMSDISDFALHHQELLEAIIDSQARMYGMTREEALTGLIESMQGRGHIIESFQFTEEDAHQNWGSQR